MTVGTNTVMHDTIRLERQLAHPPSAVFAAYADVDQRVAWTAPSDDEIVVFEADDFRVGGLDQFRCGPRRAPDFVGTTRYDHIIDNELIVFTERLVHGDQLLAMSLITWALTPTATGTTLVITDQVTSLAGQGPIDGSRDGYAAILDRLATHLQEAVRGGSARIHEPL
ncbi:MAG TPA: SRPBCC domain-containing protein [Polyangiaceae bacterium]|nr:SRPBCC domain-containing protein [Polyangiaceae bacterium]